MSKTQKIQLEDADKNKLLLKALLEKLSAESEVIEVGVEEHVEKLLAATKRFQEEKHIFKVGDLVVWKEGLKHKKVPKYGFPAVVIEVLDTPMIDTEAPLASPYYQEKLDIVLGVLDDEDDLLCFYYDSNRFEPYTKEATK